LKENIKRLLQHELFKVLLRKRTKVKTNLQKIYYNQIRWKH